MNQKSTTLTALYRLDRQAQLARMLELVEVNCQTLRRQLEWIATQPPAMRLFRITSTFVPASAHYDFADLHGLPQFRQAMRSGLEWVRPFARLHGIRLCTHPGQFTTLCSQSPDVVERSIEDLLYHADLADLMGYGDGWHPDGFAINIHGNVRLDPGLRRFKHIVQTRLSPLVRNLLTIENDEFSCGVDDLVASGIGAHIPMVLDIHHHWIASRGEYIQPTDPRIAAFVQSWRGLRPLSHVSMTDRDLIATWPTDRMPDYRELEGMGHKPSKLRAHSNLLWNTAVLDWAIGHLAWTDLEVEAKGKNLASAAMLARAVQNMAMHAGVD